MAEDLHDAKAWDASRPLFLLLNKFATCYHIVYRLGIYKWEGWATPNSRAEGALMWHEARKLMDELIYSEPLAAFDAGESKFR